MSALAETWLRSVSGESSSQRWWRYHQMWDKSQMWIIQKKYHQESFIVLDSISMEVAMAIKSKTFIASRHTNTLCDSSQQQHPESEEWSCMEGVCVIERILNQLIMKNSQCDLHMPKIKELFKVKSSELPERRRGEGSWGVHISLQLLLESKNMKSSIRCYSSKQMRLNDFSWYPWFEIWQRKRKICGKTFSNHMKHGVIYDSLRKGF